MKWRHHWMMIAVCIGTVGQIALAAEPERLFPTDKQGFIDALELDQKRESPGEYDVEDYETLTQFPIAGVNIGFAVNSTYIKGESRGLLKELAAALRDFPDTKILIAGHTDDTGADEFNLALSQSRALAVWNFLVEDEQIVADRLTFTGFGEYKPFADNSTEEGRAQNRRVEFIRLP